MLSIGTLSAGHAASGYYRSEGYYINGSPEAEISAIYHGRGAYEAGLSGQVDDQAFTALLDGQAPDGRKLGRIRGGEREHRAGLDLTFSAPKGVSIAALVGGDARIISAHTEAVKVALDYAEANLVQTRRMVNGALIRERGAKIIAGLFQHDTSRALDPQLHTHAVIANVVKDSSGTYRPLSNEAVFRGKMLLGQIYRNALAEKLEALGYETVALEKGLFDIKGIPQSLTETFSKRREEIEKALDTKNYEPTAVASALAALATRATKKPVERTELRAAWDAEVTALGIDLGQIVQAARSARTPDQVPDRGDLAVRAVDFAVTHHAERNAIYARDAVLDTALKFASTVNAGAISAELDRLVGSRTLFSVERRGETYLTDVENIRLEKENTQLMRAVVERRVLDMRTSFHMATGRSSDSAVAKKLADTNLTPGQKAAVALALSSTSGVVGVQGYAGTGKTYALATAVRMSQARGYAIDGIAPSHKAVTALCEAVPNASTVESALVRFENGSNLGDKSRTTLVVDEASMLSSETMNRILRMSRAAGYARTVLVGDIKQLEAVGAGSAFRALQDAGMPTALMSDIQRQRTPEGRAAVLAAIAGDVTKAMSGVTQVTEVGGTDRQDIRSRVAEMLADTYASLPPDERASTGLIVLTNELRSAVNALIQDRVRAAGEIGGGEVEIASLAPKNFTQAEAGEIGSYRLGDIVISPVAAARSGLTSNTLYAVTGIDALDRKLTLTGPDSATVTLGLHWRNRIAQKLAVFGTETQTFVEGDRVRFKITDRAHGIVNSAEGTLARAGRTVLAVKTADGETFSIPTDSLAAKGMQLAYANTAHDFQGSTVDRVLFGMSSEEKLTTQKSFYVALSRMRGAAVLVTDNVGRLAARIWSETGERVNALEALAEECDRHSTAPESRSDKTMREHPQGRETQPQDPDRTAPKEAESDRAKAGVPEERGAGEDSRKEDPQLSLLDQLKTEIERDQKTRDERSR